MLAFDGRVSVLRRKSKELLFINILLGFLKFTPYFSLSETKSYQREGGIDSFRGGRKVLRIGIL